MAPNPLGVVYMAHPLGGDVEGNSARARRWLAWLMTAEPDYAFCVPWLPFVDAFVRIYGRVDDAGHPFRDRCMRDNLAIGARCDGIALVGGRVSAGMAAERELFLLSPARFIVDLTRLGPEPPSEWELGSGPLLWGQTGDRT